jgi:hypothetical protein
MVRTLLTVLAVAALAGMACGGGSSLTAGSDEQQVERLMDHQLSLIKKGDWRELYQTYTPTFREACPYEDFLTDSFSSDDLKEIRSLRRDETTIEVDGDRAAASYIWQLDGRDIEVVSVSSPDINARVDGRWLDDSDEHTECY